MAPEALELEEAPLAIAGAEASRKRRQVLVPVCVGVGFLTLLGTGFGIGMAVGYGHPKMMQPPAMVAADFEDSQLVVIKGRDADCKLDDIWMPGAVPKTIHLVVQYCNQDKRKVIWNNIIGASLPCFEIRCHSQTYREIYVRKYFPEWADFYVNLPQPVMQADIFRYLVLYKEGGFYMDDDVDVYPGFAANFEANRTLKMIVGWERWEGADALFKWCGDADMGMECDSLANFAIAAQAGTETLVDIVRSSQEYFKHNTTGIPFQDVLQGTGPVRFTTVVMHQTPLEQVQWIGAFGCTGAVCDTNNSRVWLRHRFEGKWKDDKHIVR